jgi:hypothetical protein
VGGEDGGVAAIATGPAAPPPLADAGALAFEDAFDGALAVAFAFAFADALAGPGALAFAGALAVAGAFAFADALVGAGGFTGTLAVAGALGVTGMLDFAGAPDAAAPPFDSALALAPAPVGGIASVDACPNSLP